VRHLDLYLDAWTAAMLGLVPRCLDSLWDILTCVMHGFVSGMLGLMQHLESFPDTAIPVMLQFIPRC